MRSAFVLSTLAFVVPALGAPALVPIIKRDGPVRADSYIIKFKEGGRKDSILGTLTKGFTQAGSGVTYKYDSAFHGVAAKLVGSDLTLVQQLQNIEYIEQDSVLSVSYEQGPVNVDERSQIPSRPLEERGADGTGVVIYAIDSGIYVEHSCFGGRARWGAVFGGYNKTDGDGHGTHTAGIAVGKGFGLATGAEIVAIKVISDTGDGYLSDIVAGINYALADSKKTNKPAVVTMSVGGLSNKSLNDAVKNAIAQGLHFTVAAGNYNLPASLFSPPNVRAANTIGAVDSKKNFVKWSSSAFGDMIDVWAPGVNIRSAWIGGPHATNVMSGTSMATPYVAGILAVALSKYGQQRPEVLSDYLKGNATHSVTFSWKDVVAKVTSNDLLARPW